MTTQHSYPEHNDVDASVVEHTHASETTPSSPSADVTAPAREESPEAVAAQDAQSAEGQATPLPVAMDGQDGSSPTPQDTKQDHEASSGNSDNNADNAGGETTNEGEVKTFTAFIEEFRQAEERFSRALREAQETQGTQEGQQDSPSPLASPTTASTAHNSSVEEVFVPEFSMPWEIPHVAATPTFEPTEEATLRTESATTEAAPPETREAPVTAEASEPTTPPARPVSPLLRPASRIRLPRHSARHREEAKGQPATANVTSQAESQVTPTGKNEAASEAAVQPTETPPSPVEEQPRPARRYRFDNLTKTTPPAPAAPVVSSTATDTHPANGHTNGHSQSSQTVEREAQPPVKSVATTANQSEQASAKATPEGEMPGAEQTAAQPQSVTEPERRRKHGQERQRGKAQAIPQQQSQAQPQQAQQPPATVAEIATTLNAQQVIPDVVEPAAEQKDSVEPEDLPPLEYAELQKANTRRRRRRHTNGGSVAGLTGPNLPATPEIAAPTLAPGTQQRSIAPSPTAIQPRPVVAPSTTMPQRPAATPPPYTITSGYTVSQMNQGNDNAGPFMGPEPSPARGTMAAQNVRSIRTDAQRTPVYPVRSTEATSASVNQLANIVAQAIQTQTDRMVAELRRANQAPTNISVSMPPFPSNERVGVFVDVANLLYSARTLRMAVDFGKLLDFLRGNRRLIRAHAYCPTSPQPGDEQMFLQAVKGLGYRITTKNYKTFSSGAKKADLDLDLCMDVVRLVDGRAVDCIVLVSGDSDFMPMLDYCSDHGVRVEVAAFDEAMSATLRQSCDLFINLSMLEEIRA